MSARQLVRQVCGRAGPDASTASITRSTTWFALPKPAAQWPTALDHQDDLNPADPRRTKKVANYISDPDSSSGFFGPPLELGERELQRRGQVRIRFGAPVELREHFTERHVRAPVVVEREARFEVRLRLAP